MFLAPAGPSRVAWRRQSQESRSRHPNSSPGGATSLGNDEKLPAHSRILSIAWWLRKHAYDLRVPFFARLRPVVTPSLRDSTSFIRVLHPWDLRPQATHRRRFAAAALRPSFARGAYN